MQRKEVRIALGVVGVLLAIFAGALVWRVAFPGTAKEDAVVAAPDTAPKDAADKNAAQQPAERKPQEPTEPPTVLTATKRDAGNPVAPQPEVHDTPSHEGLAWQGSYGGRGAAAESTEPLADQAPHDAAATADQFSSYAGQAGDEFGPVDDSPYGYGAAPQPEPGADDYARGESPAAEQAAPAAAPASRSSRNQLRTAAAAPGGNPLRGQERRAPAAGRSAAERAASAGPLAPDLSEQAHESGASADVNPLDAGGWSYSPAQQDGYAAADDAAAHEPGPEEPQHASTSPSVPVKAAAQPRRLDATPPPAEQDAPPSRPRGADVVTASAEAETSPAEPAAAAPVDAPPEGTYRVAARDTYWRIARSVYGDPAYYRALYEHNRKQHPRADRLAAGTLLETPDLATLERLYPQYCPTSGPN